MTMADGHGKGAGPGCPRTETQAPQLSCRPVDGQNVPFFDIHLFGCLRV